MPKCKNDKTRSYKGTEPSPKGLGWCAHGEKVGKKRKGADGNRWVVKKISNGSKRWVKYTLPPKNKNKKTKIVTKQELTKKYNCNKFVKYIKKTTIFGYPSFEVLKGIQHDSKHIYEYVSYNKFKDVLTEIPKGFRKSKFADAESHCGSKTLLTKDNLQYKKIQAKHKGYKTYFIHWNGDRPYLVYVGKKTAFIYEENKDMVVNQDYYILSPPKWTYIKFVGKICFKKAYVGVSPKNDMTTYSAGYGKAFLGNTILFQITKNEYLFIGGSRGFDLLFTMTDKFEAFWSPVGNSDVPYPFVIGKEKIYFLLDNTYVLRSDLPDNLTKTQMTDLYSYYFAHNDQTDPPLKEYAKIFKSRDFKFPVGC